MVAKSGGVDWGAGCAAVEAAKPNEAVKGAADGPVEAAAVNPKPAATLLLCGAYSRVTCIRKSVKDLRAVYANGRQHNIASGPRPGRHHRQGKQQH